MVENLTYFPNKQMCNVQNLSMHSVSSEWIVRLMFTQSWYYMGYKKANGLVFCTGLLNPATNQQTTELKKIPWGQMKHVFRWSDSASDKHITYSVIRYRTPFPPLATTHPPNTIPLETTPHILFLFVHSKII